ncbi:MAG: DEAD/DEAH box helicase [Spirochaetaceae bacterium]|jgi:ATP-dependent RNA helicase RhlB|nr:DEAD/DEAH box helicase [Spirochaetaceae bacterium]
MEFSTLALHSDLKKGLAEAGFVSAMPVQEQVIANAFSGRDLYVQSQTGTGKTLAYLIVIMQRLISEPPLAGRKALIMVPTRELAVQVEDEARLLGKYLPFRTGAFYGGVGYGVQQQSLRDEAQILVGTPGRVLDLNASGYMNLMNIAFLVLDEADRMFDMGFYPDLRKLVKVVPPADRRQTMLFSATLNTYVRTLAYEYTKEPIEIEIEPEHITVNEIEQILYHVPSVDKMRLLLGILRRENPESAIIFCNTKRYTETIAKRLRENGIPCEFISGDLPQQKRLSIIDSLKAGNLRFLVATDVAARGLDIEGLALVVNYDLPVETENYVHRIGRTARAGKTGKAVSFASEQDVYELADIEKYLGDKIPSRIASESLYSDDTSGRRPSRQREEPPRRDDSARRGGFGRRDAAERRDDAKRRDDSERRDGYGRRQRPARNGGRREGAPAAADSSANDPMMRGMTMDQRVAFFKSKYGGKQVSEEKPADGDSGGTRPRRNRRRRPEGSRAGAAPTAENPVIPESRQGRRPRDPSRGRVNAAGTYTKISKPQEPVQKPTPQAPEKGILSRIFGLFKKDK